MNGDKFGVLSVSIFAQPSVLSSDSLNGLYEEFIPSRTPTQSSFSAPIDTSLNECRSKNNVCSVNAECTDSTVLYQCQCAANYTDVTEQMDLFGMYSALRLFNQFLRRTFLSDMSYLSNSWYVVELEQ